MTVGYFSFEYGIKNWLKIFSGGLGVLAGDHLKEAADMGLPLVGVGIDYHKGYFKQHIADDGWQTESYPPFESRKFMGRLPQTVQVQIEDRKVTVYASKYEVRSPNGNIVPLILLSTNGDANADWDREITSTLYGGDNYTRLTQEVVLGVGGVRMLQALGYDIETYHMNEGHAAFLTLELLRQLGSAKKAMDKAAFTTHTPVEAGHDRFSYTQVNQVTSSLIPPNIGDLAGRDDFNMTVLAMSMSRYINAVSKKHAEVMRAMFPGREIDYITNGIHTRSWTSNPFKLLYDLQINGWRDDPRMLSAASGIPLEQLIAAHGIAKATSIDIVQSMGGRFEQGRLQIGFARRFATYKRASLIMRDVERLIRIGGDNLQIVYAGKSHPKDTPGKEEIQKVQRAIRELNPSIPSVFIDDYDMDTAAALVAGVDVWFNTPLRPREASGTSGMKAAANGVPNFSVLDGWIIESGVPTRRTGWPIGRAPVENTLVAIDDAEDAESLYEVLEHEIIPLFLNDQKGFAEIMRNAIAEDAPVFNTRRMMLEYMEKAYRLPLPK